VFAYFKLTIAANYMQSSGIPESQSSGSPESRSRPIAAGFPARWPAACRGQPPAARAHQSRNLLRRMAESSTPPAASRPGGPVPRTAAAGPSTAAAGPSAAAGRRGLARSAAAAAAVIVGSLLLGLLAGYVWQLVAPRALFVLVSRGAADVVNPETTAFISADAWFCLLAAVGGVLTGLLGYRFAVRRYGPLPLIGVFAGSAGAAYAAMWIGQRSGAAAFNARLSAARPGAMLHAPLVLGAHSALAFWPLAAGVVAGGLEAARLMHERQQATGRHSGGQPGPAGDGNGSTAAPEPPGAPGPAALPRPAARGTRGSAGTSGAPEAAGPAAQEPSPWPEQRPWAAEQPWGGRPSSSGPDTGAGGRA